MAEGADQRGLGAGLPWHPSVTRQVQGRKTEREVLTKRGARVHPNSGAGNIKDDGSDDDAVYEVKDARKTYTLNGKHARDMMVRANRQGKSAKYIVIFDDLGIEVEMEIRPSGRKMQ